MTTKKSLKEEIADIELNIFRVKEVLKNLKEELHDKVETLHVQTADPSEKLEAFQKE